MEKKMGKGKEYYYNGKLRFIGEYLNGKRWNGKGYNINSNLEFEIKNGNRKVKEYNIDSELEFEGEYLNGKRWNGKFKEYDEEGELKLERKYLNGKILQ